MEVFQRMTENNKQAEGTDTKAKTNYDTAIFAGGCFLVHGRTFRYS